MLDSSSFFLSQNSVIEFSESTHFKANVCLKPVFSLLLSNILLLFCLVWGQLFGLH